MTVDEAKNIISELRERFDAPFNSADKNTIEKLYVAVLGRTFVPTTCQQCYHDAVIEIYHFLRNNNKMAEKSNYVLRAGAIIMNPNFEGGKVYTNDNLTDKVAAAFLKKYPKQKVLFQRVPKAAKATKSEEAGAEEKPAEGAEA